MGCGPSAEGNVRAQFANLVIGDQISLGAGCKKDTDWVSIQNMTNHGVNWVHCCQEGATASLSGDGPIQINVVLAKADPHIKKLWAIVYLGVNDAKKVNWEKEGYAESFCENLKNIKKLVKDKDMNCLIIIPPSGPKIHDAYSTEALKTEIPDQINTIKTGPKTRIFDPRTLMASNVYFQEDNVTLSEEGHKCLSQAVFEELKKKK